MRSGCQGDFCSNARRTKPWKEVVEKEDGKKYEVEHNPFVMTFEPDGYEATKKDVAGNQLNYAMQMNVASDPLHMKMTTLAHYRGFVLRALEQKSPWQPERMLDLHIIGQNSYAVRLDFASGIGTIQRINNVIDGMDKQAKLLQENIERCSETIKRGEAADVLQTKLVLTMYQLNVPLLILLSKSRTSLRSLP